MRRFVPASWTIRTRLVVTLAVVVSAFISVSATISTLAVRDFLEQRVSARLTSSAERMHASLVGLPGLTLDIGTIADMARAESTAVVLDTAGRPPVVLNTDSTTADRLLATDLADGRAHPVAGRSGMVAIRLDARGSGLSVVDGARTLHPDGIIVAVDASADLATFQTMALANTGGVLLAIGLLVLLTVVIVSRSLRPLRTMSEQARAFAAGDRSRRLHVPTGDPDITRLAAAVNQAFDAQHEAEDRLRAFVADASHELRTPLTTATGWIELYLQGGLDDRADREHAMQRVGTQLGRMRTLIDELALLARLDRVRALDAAVVDLSALAADVVEDARVMNPDRTFTLRAPRPALLLGDAAKLQQVLVNLLGNAVQHTPPGTGVEVTVTPAAEGPGTGRRSHTLLVTDHGPGIASQDQPHVFERFWRGDASRDRHSGGSGLGLAIVASTVAAHGGSSEVASRVGLGTTITITLPAQEAAPGPAPDLQVVAAPTPWGSRAGSQPSSRTAVTKA